MTLTLTNRALSFNFANVGPVSCKNCALDFLKDHLLQWPKRFLELLAQELYLFNLFSLYVAFKGNMMDLFPQGKNFWPISFFKDKGLRFHEI